MAHCKQEFKSLEEGVVRLYSCGPTVYNYSHIGNLRTFLFSDIVARYFVRAGYQVLNVMNITDVDDKTIAGALQEGITLREFTDIYIGHFFSDLTTLCIQPSWKYPRATDYIKQMQDIIVTLIDKGYAYESNGSVYFDVSSYPHYGRLSGVVQSGNLHSEYSRLETNEYNVNDVRDFALWKCVQDGELFWDSPWGPGRPGWHIECSTM